MQTLKFLILKYALSPKFVLVDDCKSSIFLD